MSYGFHIIVPLPHGRVGTTGYMSVYFVPRLQETGLLADWAEDWRNWPKVINGNASGGAGALELNVGLAPTGGSFTVSPANAGLTVASSKWLSPPPSAAAWDAAFATNTASSIRVDRFRPVVRTETDVIAPMYDAIQATTQIPNLYRQIAVDHPTTPPTVNELSSVGGYIGFGNSGLSGDYDDHMAPLGDGDVSDEKTPEEADFHAALTLIQAHPELLRSLGLVVELEVALASGRNRVSVSSNFEAGYAPGRTVSTEVVFGSDFWPVTGPGSWAPIGDGSHAVGCIDIGAAISGTGEMTDGLGDDDPAAVTPLREKGLHLVRDGVDLVDEVYDRWEKQREFEDRVREWLLLPAGPGRPPLPVDGELLVTGRRYDVFDTTPQRWFSLWDRIVPGGFGFPRNAALSITPDRDEGWMTYTAMTESSRIRRDPPGDTDPPPAEFIAPPSIDDTPIRISPILFGWNGWGNVSNPPGRAFSGLTGATDLAPNEPTAAMGAQVSVEYAVPDRVLPRLRYTRTYKFRARVVDLAGNSRSIEDDHFGAFAETSEITYGRKHPLGAPVLVRREPRPDPGVGDATATCVIRSEFGQDDATVTPTARLLFPTKTSQLQCELHGFPAPDGLFRDEPTFKDVAARSETSIEDDTTTDPNSGELLAPSVDWTPPVNYLTEPAYAGFALIDVPGSVGPATMTMEASWPNSHAVGFEVRAGDAAPVMSAPTPDAPAVVVSVPKGITRDVRTAQVPSQALLDHWTLLAGMSPAERLAVEEIIRTGRHWMFSQHGSLKLIHAVRRPLAIPTVDIVSVSRPAESPFVELAGTLWIDVKSTGTVEIRGRWTDPVDTPGATDGVVNVSTSRLFFTQTEGYDEESSVQLDTTSFDIGDTKRHSVDVLLDAYSRYARHFTERSTIRFGTATGRVVLASEGVSDLNIQVVSAGVNRVVGRLGVDFTIDHEAGAIQRTSGSRLPTLVDVEVDFIRLPINRRSDEEGATISVTFPNSGVPGAPALVEALPAFARERSLGANEVGVVHQGQTIRVWLERPWFTTGEGETLGVLIGETASGPASELARDPLSSSGPTRALVVGDFSAATVTRTGIGGLDVAGHDVVFDPDRNQWYSDVVLSGDFGYRPILKLVLVRLQPVSIPGAYFGDSVTTEPIRLGARRDVSVKLTGSNLALSVTGLELGNTVTARLQFSDPDIIDSDLSWKDLGSAVTLAATAAGARTEWTGSVPVPQSSDPIRVLFEDAEDLDGGPTVVYVETVPVPGAWVGSSGPLTIAALTVQGGHEAALVKWIAPVGAAVTGFRLERSSDGGVWTGVDLSANRSKFIARGLTNGTSYSFRVRASDASGPGPWSESVAVVPQITKPGKVRRFAGTSGASVVALEWKAVATQGAPITAYVIERRAEGGSWGNPVTVGGTATSTNVRALLPGASLQFRVRAENAAGAGDWSTPITVVVTTAGTPPGQVHGVNVAGAPASVSATWLPADDGGASLLSYEIERRLPGGVWGSTQATKPDVLVAEFIGLASKTVYEVRVRAKNVVGVGEWSVAGVGSTK